ncbi:MULTISPECIES: hypothetical protein [unclassified Frigoribacterium]|jgi:hypothetical protein|uniref:hypothetical protein n=1 Tax=unclassified Frigoribacterium TaxID=2627005 RepID=UPI0006FEB9EB|nr:MULTISPECIES: hypothetical protein [unclassified Frigoribacterium]KQM23615.1 hypothetical protein ASL10_15155 [Frigoribacterium sp. Leaf8]KQO45153.1 hypothetical protein ASF07_15535 [Frigoribacterium sp. Leaf254]KQT40536.1 hypothetical protein ASG28_14245 [Frigoribacterium sp. Leaf415]MBD8486817.1 hypothetical protein [Frigoribacterium sp. CFBP 8759]ROS53690.1 hypothetical protein EDF21_1539 [Frigoribacterium sp. PhB118]
MTSKTSVPVATRFYGTGPQFDALALEVDDFSAASRRDSRDAGRFLTDVLETQLRHLRPVSQILLLERIRASGRVSGSHFSTLRGVLSRTRAVAANTHGMDVSTNALLLPASRADALSEPDVLDLVRHRPLQATGVVLDHHVPVRVGRLRESLSAPVL